MKKQIIWALAIGLGLYANDLQAQQRGAANSNPGPKTEQGANKGNKDKGQKTPAEQAKRRAEQMTKKYSLNADQSGKLEALFLQGINKRQALRSSDLPKEQIKVQRKALRGEQEAGLKTILSPQQYAQVLNDREKAKAARAANKGKGGDKGKAKGKDKKTKTTTMTTTTMIINLSFLL